MCSYVNTGKELLSNKIHFKNGENMTVQLVLLFSYLWSVPMCLGVQESVYYLVICSDFLQVMYIYFWPHHAAWES